MTEISQPSPHPSGSDRCCGQKHHKSPATIFMVMISSVEPLQPWVAEHRGLRHWRAHGATLKSKIEGAWCLRRDREERSWGGWPVAASPEMGTRDEAWLGGGADHDQLQSSSPLSFSPLYETLSFQTALAKHPIFPHFYLIKACYLAVL